MGQSTPASRGLLRETPRPGSRPSPTEEITNRTTHIFTGGCHFLTADSDNTPRPPILAADKCTSVNGNERILKHTPSSCELQVIPRKNTKLPSTAAISDRRLALPSQVAWMEAWRVKWKLRTLIRDMSVCIAKCPII